MSRRTYALAAIACVGAAALAAGGCGRQAVEDVVNEAVAPPPSVREAPAAARVVLDAGQAAELNVQVHRISQGDFEAPLALPGTAYPAPENLAIVSAPISGRVARIYAHEGEAVRRGDVLLELESLEYAGLVADLVQAKAEAAYQEKQVERLQLLVERKISPRSALDKADADRLRARAWVQAAHARLHALGLTDEELEAWSPERAEHPVLPIRAPLTGVVSEHAIDAGQAVTAYEKMLSLVNLDAVLIRGYVSPEDAPLIRPGDPVRVSMKEFPDRNVAARVLTVNPALDEVNKSVTVNIHARTQDGWPLPGQNVNLEILTHAPTPVLTVPLAAVHYEGDQATVFVRLDEHTFERRSIVLGRMGSRDAVVTSGLKEGDEVAVTQVFSLKALGRFAQYSEE